MEHKRRILCVVDKQHDQADVPAGLSASYDLVEAHSPMRALSWLMREHFDGMYVAPGHFQEALRLERLLQYERILGAMPDGVVLVEADNTILWANERFRQWTGKDNPVSMNFFDSLDQPEILGPDYTPFHTALASREPSGSTLKANDRYFHLHAAPIREPEDGHDSLIVTVRDVTEEVLQQQKITAIHKAGIELANLTPDEVFQMTVEDRIELLKANILHYTRDVLNFDVIEIRLLDQKTNELAPLLAVGMDDTAMRRKLYASPKDNGVTGYVAATGMSYLCENTLDDPLYLEGFKGAKSSLTVPLRVNDQVYGTFNVESPEPRAFTESDLQFLEIFSRDVAHSLNTLELLVAQRANAAQESCEAIHSAVALPVDEILNDAVNVMERYIGHEPEMVQRLQSILRNARDIKQVIQSVGQRLAPAEAVPTPSDAEQYRIIRGARVLVVDADEAVRVDAHTLLDRVGCVVETAHTGAEALAMVRNSQPVAQYHVIIADIRLTDMNGYDFLLRLKALMEPAPLALMAGFGYDPGHSIVKARQAGLHPNAVLYKPFRRDQLLRTIELIVEQNRRTSDE